METALGIDLTAEGANLYTANYTTTELGIYLPQLKTDSGTILPISTVTSSEYTQDVTNDKQTLSVLSQRTNGLLNPTPASINQKALSAQTTVLGYFLDMVDYMWLVD